MTHLLEHLASGVVRVARPSQDRPVVYRGKNFQIVGYGVFAMLAAISIIVNTALYMTLKGSPLVDNFVLLNPPDGLCGVAGIEGHAHRGAGRHVLAAPGQVPHRDGLLRSGRHPGRDGRHRRGARCHVEIFGACAQQLALGDLPGPYLHCLPVSSGQMVAGFGRALANPAPKMAERMWTSRR
ncbi:MAG: hypothetical protein ABIJ09_02560 [Pseudomonadota bacterium]